METLCSTCMLISTYNFSLLFTVDLLLDENGTSYGTSAEAETKEVGLIDQ